jgi:hypothetical protein
MKICEHCNATCGVAVFTDLLNILLLFLSLSFAFFLFLVTFFHFLPLAPSVSPGSTGELFFAGSGVGDLDGDDYRIFGLVHVLVHLELQSRPELERSGELVVTGSGVGDLDGAG